MKKKTVKLSSTDIQNLVRRIVKEDNGQQLSLEFPDYDDRHPYLVEIEKELQYIGAESRINTILESLESTNITHAIEDIDSELSGLETDLQSLEKQVYDNEEVPQEVIWGITDKISSLLDVVYDLQEFYRDLNNLQDLYFRIKENYKK